MKNRRFTAEFRVAVAKRIVNGESVTAIHREHAIKRSVLYRWRDAYMKAGDSGLCRSIGRPPAITRQAPGELPTPACAGLGVPAEEENAKALQKHSSA